MASTTLQDVHELVPAERIPTDATEVFALHGDFVRRTLQRLGVRDADLEDLAQEVFVVVHRQLAGFAGNARFTTWLYAIALRVVSTHRRRAWVRRESPRDVLPETRAARGPEEALGEAQERQQLHEVLELMSLEKRALFVMFELDQLPCQDIADALGIPVGTVHSRLHAARQEFKSACARWQARARRPRRGRTLASTLAAVLLGWKSLALAATLGVAGMTTVLVARQASLPERPVRMPAAPRTRGPSVQPAIDATRTPVIDSALEAPRAESALPQRLDAPSVPVVESPRAARRSTQRSARVPASAPPAPAEDTLAREIAMLAEARALLDRDPAAAFSLLDRHARLFAAGSLSIERELLALDVLERLGRDGDAQLRARSLLGRARGTIYEARVRARLKSP